MKIRDSVIENIEKMPVEKVIMVNQFISRMGGNPRKARRCNPRAYLKAQKALAGCKGSMSADILEERNESI
jgi:hypothetical protein